MFESLYALHRAGRLPEGMSPEEAEQRVVKAIGKGLLKVLSKMGISTIRSYTGAQIFEAVGLEQRAWSTGTSPAPPRGSAAWASTRSRARRSTATRAPTRPPTSELLPAGGRLRVAPRRRVPRLEPRDDRHAPARRARRATAPRPTSASPRYVNDVAVRAPTLRGLLRFRDDVDPLPLEEVEPAHEIVGASSRAA